MLIYWMNSGEEWADEACEALIDRFPALDVSRGADGRVVMRDAGAVFALHKAESEALGAVHRAWRGAFGGEG